MKAYVVTYEMKELHRRESHSIHKNPIAVYSTREKAVEFLQKKYNNAESNDCSLLVDKELKNEGEEEYEETIAWLTIKYLNKMNDSVFTDSYYVKHFDIDE